MKNQQPTALSEDSAPQTDSRSKVIGFRETFPYLRPYRLSLLLAFIVGLISTVAASAQPLVVSKIVDTFTDSLPTGLALLVVALLLISAGATALRQLIMQRAGERFAFDTRNRLIRHIYRLPMETLERRSRADLVSRVTTDVSKIREILTSGLVELATTGMTVVVSIVFMATIDLVLLALAGAVTGAIVVSVYVISRRTRPAGLRLQDAIGELSGSVSRVIGGMKTIRATRAENRETQSTLSFVQRALDAGLSVAGLRAIVQTVSGLAVQLLLIAVIGVGALRVSSGAMTTGDLTAFIMYLMLMATPLAMFGGIMSMLGESFGALSRVLDVEAEVLERDVQNADAPSPVAADDQYTFKLDDVSFEYPAESFGEQPQQALHEISAVFPNDATIAIVGPSGAGKSTLFALLERFYEPTHGTINFRGQDIAGMSRDGLRKQIAYVDQDAVSLSGSVRDNLLLGAPDSTDEHCISVLRHVGLAASEHEARQFLGQEVGELGGKLSGGQRQRLAIARAVISDAPIMLLDEITSNLDSRNEALVTELLLTPTRDHTVIVIAHRFSTVVAADLIFVMDEGRIVAHGTHQELLSKSDLYKELAERQFISERS